MFWTRRGLESLEEKRGVVVSVSAWRLVSVCSVHMVYIYIYKEHIY